ncbi:hypothetical protein [Mucilaginibacter sp. NFR10]|nr:hypothetical protein [Mucilaginibacter sp. NFR10]SCW71901.1 hypothetical protein SAMN03159284_03451 [Mucilaginibacter sp. NFR10]
MTSCRIVVFSDKSVKQEDRDILLKIRNREFEDLMKMVKENGAD